MKKTLIQKTNKPINQSIKMKKISLFLICSILIGLTSCQEEYPEHEEGLYAEFKTNNGTFDAEL